MNTSEGEKNHNVHTDNQLHVISLLRKVNEQKFRVQYEKENRIILL